MTDLRKRLLRRPPTPRAVALSIQERLGASNTAYLAFCFIVPVLLMYLIYLAMQIHPFGDGNADADIHEYRGSRHQPGRFQGKDLRQNHRPDDGQWHHVRRNSELGVHCYGAVLLHHLV